MVWKMEAGFEEIDHTADWAIRVWAPSIIELLQTAVKGMYALSGIRLGGQGTESRAVKWAVQDLEMLLVDFLSELVFFGENGLGVAEMELDIIEGALTGRLLLAPITGQAKEIKAVTYHGLVFDV
jgi:SHS2 domain-containing protein